MSSKLTGLVLAGLTAGLAGLIFAFDLWLPLGVAVPMLYTALVLLSLWVPYRQAAVLIALGASVLLLLGLFLPPSGAAPWTALANRLLALCTLWATTGLLLLHRRAEDALQESEARLRLVLEQLPAIIWITDAKLRITLVQGAGLADLKLHPSQLIGTTLQEHFPEKSDRPPLAAHQVALRGEPCSCEMKIRDRWLQAYIEPLRASDATITGCLGIALDVTGRKKAEEARENLILVLQDALENIKTLRGLLPICASCNKIRDTHGHWDLIETYIQEHSDAHFTHSICPECTKKLYPQFG
jgi:PAS domain S-box-containing protein